ncbi:MAG: UDP-N-acetylmuramoyl-L-alanyl-D-glutamate--2,6-diaminopimelate ligase [bacterium]
MKNLSDLIINISVLESHGPLDVMVPGISLNSKDIKSGGLFVALIGSISDGHTFIGSAIDSGAKIIVHQNDLEVFVEGVTYIKVADTHEAVGLIASAFYEYPSGELKLIGVTGTNGKTTIATLLHQLFINLGHRAGMIGTVVNKINEQSQEAERTTPDAISLNKLLRAMVDAKCTYCFMEVSSHSVSERRIAGLVYAGGVFTNLTLDHLDYHKTIEAYRDAKKAFFDSLSESAFALSNIDDANGKYMLSGTQARKYYYGFKSEADFDERLETKLIGEFNAYNILAIYGAAVLLDEDRGMVKQLIKSLEPVAGRFQSIKSSNGIVGIVDYAHTPDALQNVLLTVNGMREGSAQIITLFGCGGDRDKSKRPIMANMAYNMSDIVILTSDNPRTENPEFILADMVEGLPEGYDKTRVYVISDRGEAIEKACSLAKSGDYMLLAGKGHETYQIIGEEKIHFDDMEEIKKYLK